MSPEPRPPAIVLDDLAEPRFTDDARAILDMMAEAGAQSSLRPDALMATAVDQTGLDDFGSHDFVARLDVLCAPCGTRPGSTTPASWPSPSCDRPATQSAPARGPDRAASRDPGSRSGAAHRHLRPAPHRQHPPAQPDVRRPCPAIPPLLGERGAGPLRRGASGSRRCRILGGREPRCPSSFLDVAMPEFKRMHEMTVDHVHEEIQLLAIDFSTMLFETIAPIPAWRDDYLARDQRPSYAYLKKILQATAVAPRRYPVGAQVASAPRAVPRSP